MLAHLTSAVVLLGATLAATTAATVEPLSFAISATSQNVQFAAPPDANNATQIIAFLHAASTTGVAVNGTRQVSGTFAVTGSYCKPTTARVRGILQVLVHGATYDKTLWSGLGQGARYDYRGYANAAGYHTLALDRLGHGSSPQHPDPVAVNQAQLQLEILHRVLAAVRSNRSNRSNALGRSFAKIVYVGHSLGSFLGAAIARTYPADADALVLTGYSTAFTTAAIAAQTYAPGALFSPSRFGSALPLGYVVTAVEAERSRNGGAFYGGAFDTDVARADFARQDTAGAGEFASLPGLLLGGAGGGTAADAYAGAVFVATGQLDAAFCVPTAGRTCADILQATGESFPRARAYKYYAPADTGHVLSLHYSAPATFRAVHEFLDGVL
ncbi:hypothetical protein B0T24DRAFT_695493 [Lasiosphaeria ovina]|uniref:AB hydrolase-1 domain-containing protein n=1 Tax=Lasiosphaeria ovina TaxID=92902 RepID=A0AAE0NDS0_9PEZI|nr:hypothetical protein B0T24DRAFT_695493 [Lasiosphaeria ovina]